MVETKTIIISLILLIVAVGAYFLLLGKHLDISGGSCTDFVKIPGSVACGTAADCVPQGITPDAGIVVRCNSGVCEVKMTTCSGTVAP